MKLLHRLGRLRDGIRGWRRITDWKEGNFCSDVMERPRVFFKKNEIIDFSWNNGIIDFPLTAWFCICLRSEIKDFARLKRTYVNIYHQESMLHFIPGYPVLISCAGHQGTNQVEVTRDWWPYITCTIIISRWSMIVRLSEVLRGTVRDDIDWRCRRQPQRKSSSKSSELWIVSRCYKSLDVVLIGRRTHDVIGRLSVKPWCNWLRRL